MENKIAIKVNNLVKVYKMYNNKKDMLFENISPLKKNRHTDYYALNGISFDVKQGETFGIIGTNGAGKSTLLKMITGVSSPTEGTVEVNGKVAALLELGAGFNVEYSGIDNIYLNGTMMGYSKKEMEQRIPQILEFADIGDFIYQPVKTYSSGMFARLAFSVEKGIMQMCGDSIEVCNEYTNSILKKGHASEKETDVAYKVEKFNTTNFPAISYTNDSILNDSVKIISCFIEDKNGIKVNECKINEKYTVSVVFESYREIKSCIAGFVIETVKGLWVINTNSSICGNKGSFYVKKGSLNRVDFTFVMPPLMRAEYVMGVAVAEGTSKDYEILTWLYNAFAVNIVNNGNNSALIDVETEIKIYEKEGKEET